MTSSTTNRGAAGELLARHYLEKKGWKHLASNWRCKVGEFDLVMQHGSTRVFVEVRLRQPTSFGEGLETIGWQKQRKLVRCAQFYQQKENYWGNCRFDVISISQPNNGEPTIIHIENAFEVE